MSGSRGRFHGDRPDVGDLPVGEDVEREIRAHLAERTDELIAEGWEPGAARAEAERLFGDVERIRARSEAETRARDRAVRRAYTWEAVMQDVRYTLRSLMRSPGFAVVAVLTLALGIGANSAIFSILNGVLLQPLPYAEPERIVWIDEAHEGPDGRPGPVPWSNFRDWQETSGSFESMAAFGGGAVPILGGDRPVSVTGISITSEFWDVFQVVPAAGRLTLPEEHVLGGPGVVVVSERWWSTHTGRDPQLVGRVIEVAGRSAEVVGIAPAGFNFPFDADVWYPMERFEQATSRTAHNNRIVAKLRPGVTPTAADAELDRISVQMVEGLPPEDYDITGAIVIPLRERVAGSARQPLFLLMAASLMVLLVAATNLASTLLARGTNRTRELAVRASLGARRGRLIRQLLTESLVLSLAGAVVGLVLAAWVLRLIQRLGADSIPRIHEIGIDPVVILFTFGAAGITTLLCGLLPALRLSDDGLATALRSGTRGSTSGQGAVWKVLVGAEVALALLLLAGGGLLLRSFQEILSVDGGFETEGVATVTTRLSPERYPELSAYADYYERLSTRLAATPEIENFAIANAVPLGSGLSTGSVNLNYDEETFVSPGTYVAVTPGYFEVFGIPLVQGRLFTEADRDPEGQHVVIVSESYAEQAWPGQDPIGQVMTGGGMDSFWGQGRWATVVGVVGDVKYYSLTEAGHDPAYYFPLYQRSGRSRFGFHVIARATDGDPGTAISVMRREMAEMDDTTPLTATTMTERVGASVAERQFVLGILGAFAVLALVLAGIGIYGVVSWHVATREREMGIRLALGETPGSVRSSVVRSALSMVAGGVVIGAIGALAGGRLVQSLLFGVAPTDPLTLIAVVTTLVGTAVAAAWIPALRATRVDPILAMRAE